MKKILAILLILNGAAILLAAFALVAVLGIVSPGELGFPVLLRLTNTTGSAVKVTPVGTYHAGVRRGPLAMMESLDNPMQTLRRSDFAIRAGATIELAYDNDDITPSEVVVEDASGTLYEIPASHASPNVQVLQSPYVVIVTIPPLHSFSPPTPAVLASFREAQLPRTIPSRAYYIQFAWLSFAILLFMWWRVSKHEKAAEQKEP